LAPPKGERSPARGRHGLFADPQLSVPLGLADPDRPNIAATIWRTVSNAGARRYFFESSFSPTIFWVDLDKLNLAPGATPAKLELEDRPIIAGEASGKFTPAEPFKFLSH
jgi:penicillin V acylase-like amidase (Ntn superfamily)